MPDRMLFAVCVVVFIFGSNCVLSAGPLRVSNKDRRWNRVFAVFIWRTHSHSRSMLQTFTCSTVLWCQTSNRAARLLPGISSVYGARSVFWLLCVCDLSLFSSFTLTLSFVHCADIRWGFFFSCVFAHEYHTNAPNIKQLTTALDDN